MDDRSVTQFYFTYGDSPKYPFRGGWSVVAAPDRASAIAMFRLVHPDVRENTVNCEAIYDEADFRKKRIADKYDKDKHRCHERISLRVERTGSDYDRILEAPPERRFGFSQEDRTP